MVQLNKILHRYTKKKALSMIRYIFIRNRLEYGRVSEDQNAYSFAISFIEMKKKMDKIPPSNLLNIKKIRPSPDINCYVYGGA